MIESLTLHNFQKHKHLKVEFDPHITTITGPTNGGKSAIIRAIRWLCLNQPTGAALSRMRPQRTGSKYVKAVLKVDGHTITRKKSKTANLYILDGKKFKAFGAGVVPPEIASILNITEVNFQQQHDLHFWFSLTPGQVSKELNKIVNLEEIDQALAYIGSRVRQSKAEAEVSRQRLHQARQAYKKSKWVKEADAKLQEVEAQQALQEETHLKHVRLHSLLKQATEAIDNRDNTDKALICLKEAHDKGLETSRLAKRVHGLQELLDTITASKADVSAEIPDISLLEEAESKVQQIQKRKESLVTLLTAIARAEDYQCDLANEYARASKKLQKFQRQQPQICPTCGQKIRT